MPQRALLPRSAPAAAGVSSPAIGALLDRLAEKSIECHSLMIVRQGHVVAEGWWAPYSADRPHLLLSMTAGHRTDSLTEAWQLEPGDLVKGFLRLPFAATEGTRHTYDNSAAFILARMVERVAGRGLAEFLDERLFTPMGIDHAEWDRVGSGAAFGFHGLHLRTEAVAAFGELLLRGGRWDGKQPVPREWVELATGRHTGSGHYAEGADGADFLCGYGYQFWISRHGFHGNGAFGQHCVVVPSHDLVVVLTSAQQEVQQARQDFIPATESFRPLRA